MTKMDKEDCVAINGSYDDDVDDIVVIIAADIL
jgi:hypothetical protein